VGVRGQSPLKKVPTYIKRRFSIMNKKLSARILAIFLSVLMAGSGLGLIISLIIQLLGA
jgi:hypothetical protein